MALELTEQELLGLGFFVEDNNEWVGPLGYKMWIDAYKKVGNQDGFFHYFQRQFTDVSRMEHEFTVSSSDGGDTSTLISNIETLERFHELENVLNKK